MRLAYQMYPVFSQYCGQRYLNEQRFRTSTSPRVALLLLQKMVCGYAPSKDIPDIRLSLSTPVANDRFAVLLKGV